MSFAKTMEAARNGSREDLGKVLEACRSYMTFMAGRRIPQSLRGRVRPSSLVQEAYLRACKGVGRFEGKTEAQLTAWLRQILHRCLISTLEKQAQAGFSNHSPEDCVDENEPTPPFRAAEGECADALAREIRQLPTHYRLAIELRHFGGLSFTKLGLALGCSPEAARKIWVRAQAKLGEAMSMYR